MTIDVQTFHDKYISMLSAFNKHIFGQTDVIDLLLISVFSGGHSLITGVPGLAKTFIIRILSSMLDLNFNRIQFTPDLMPSDITGSEILETERSSGRKEFKLVKGPVFTNILLADEINRATPRTQSALLQSMQEYNVTISGVTYSLPRPFFVFATQNPIEQEGTYPLPEAQLDRFMFSILIDYPEFLDELEVIKIYSSSVEPEVSPIISLSEIAEFQKMIDTIPVSDHVLRFTLKLIRRTRPNEPDAPELVKQYCSFGAGPRAGIFLIHASRVLAAIGKNRQVSINDVIKLTYPVLRHRLILNYRAVSQGITVDQLIAAILEQLKQE